jgi:hypothetical protein
MTEIIYQVREFHDEDSFKTGVFTEREKAVRCGKENYGDSFYKTPSNARGEMEGAFLNRIFISKND